MSERFPQLFSGLAVLTVGVIISSMIAGNAVQKFRAADNTISVTGTARKAIKADYGIWRASVSLERPNQKEAYQALETQMNQVKTYLTADKQIPADAISFDAIESNPVSELLPNGNPSGKTRAYSMRQTLEVRLADVNRIASLAQESTELITRDISIQSYAPEYLYTKLSEARVAMLAEATQDARTRAEQIVKTAGSHLGPVRSVRTGVFQITRPHSTAVEDGGSYDTLTIDKDITAVLTMTFAVE